MSGGSFDYAFTGVSNFAQDLQGRLDSNDIPEVSPDMQEQVKAKLEFIANLAKYTSDLMREAEWFYSGDTGDESFIKRVVDINVGYVNSNLNKGKNDE